MNECAGLDPVRAIPLPFAAWKRCKFFAQNERVAEWLTWAGRQLVQSNCGKEDLSGAHSLSRSRNPEEHPATPFTPLLCHGIFPLSRPHLTNPGAASQFQYSTRCHSERGDSREEPYGRRRDREGRLTCLSVRCLSSYLIFPPVLMTS